jgi:hypothetical protein
MNKLTSKFDTIDLHGKINPAANTLQLKLNGITKTEIFEIDQLLKQK